MGAHECENRCIARLVVGLIAGWMVVSVLASISLRAANPQGPLAASSPSSLSSLRAVLDKYCVTCHNQRLRTAGLTLDTLDTRNVSRDEEVWEKVLRKLRVGAMPPAGLPRPDQPIIDGVVAALETALDRAAALSPNPGRTETFHRLNRAEYQNAIRDLLGLKINVVSLLPADDADTNGFDNIATVLSLSPALLERYMSVARQLSRLAVGLPPRGPVIDTYKVSQLLVQDDQVSDDLPLGSRGGVAIRHHFPADGEYVIKIFLRRNIYDYVVGLGQAHQLEVRVDGQRIARFTVGGASRGKPAPASFAGNIPGDPDWEEYAIHADASLEVRFDAKAGPRVVGVSFVGEFTEAEGVLQPSGSSFSDGTDEMPDGNPAVERVAIGGPYRTDGPGDTPSRRKIFVCRPTDSANEQPCAKKILSTLARRAYRRPVTDHDIQTLLGFFRNGSRDGGFDAGIQFALERILAAPDFLYRVEYDPPLVAPGTTYRLTDVELASRLSFFLWSSIPDDALLDVAARGKLKEPAVLEQQVRRMLADSRSKALVDNFAGQWLQLRNLHTVAPDPNLFPEFDDNLREAFRLETELFVASQVREDRSVLELLTANYTFVNERLARHYQIPNISGGSFRRVTLGTDGLRAGLLGHGSFLTVTSYPNRTSPVLRGKWVLENLLGMPPPPPPPNVPGLPDRSAAGAAASVRDRLEQHRKDLVCATCHSQMDPLGFALENFDAIGQWRTSEAGTPIDASGALPGRAPFQGLSGLRTLVLSHREQFTGTITEKLLAYALGRAAQYYDRPELRTILREAAPGNYRWSSIVLGIVKSLPFQMRRACEPLKTLAATLTVCH